MVGKQAKNNWILYDLQRAGLQNYFTLLDHVSVYFLAPIKTTYLHRKHMMMP